MRHQRPRRGLRRTDLAALGVPAEDVRGLVQQDVLAVQFGGVAAVDDPVGVARRDDEPAGHIRPGGDGQQVDRPSALHGQQVDEGLGGERLGQLELFDQALAPLPQPRAAAAVGHFPPPGDSG